MTKQLNIRMDESQIYSEIGSRPIWPLGTRGYAPDGRVYRAALNSAVALAVGRLTRPAEKTLGHANLTVAAALQPGAKSITATLTFARLLFDDYKDGLIYVNDADDQGSVYGIAGNSQTDPEGIATIDLTLSIRTVLTTSSQVTLIRNRYQTVRITETVANERALGTSPVAISADNHFWVQVAGPAAILQDGAWDENKDLVPSDQVRGAAMVASSVSQGAETRTTDVTYTDRLARSNVVPSTAVTNTIGYAIDPRADTEFGLVHLSLDV